MADEALTALHGDSWSSPRWAVTVNGAATDLTSWFIRAQARQRSEDVEPVFAWTVTGGGIVLGSATVQLAGGATISTGTVQLRLRPADWAGKPRKWSGVLDVELSSDSSGSPAERHTIVASRPFRVTPDVARG